MAWFRNYYKCANCDSEWSDDWSRKCEDDCPHCGARHMSPYGSDDLNEVIRPHGGGFAVLRSPETAEHLPDYQEVASFSAHAQAEAYLRSPESNFGPSETRPAQDGC